MAAGRAFREVEALCFKGGYRLMVWKSLNKPGSPDQWVARAKFWESASMFKDFGYHYGDTVTEALGKLRVVLEAAQ